MLVTFLPTAHQRHVFEESRMVTPNLADDMQATSFGFTWKSHPQSFSSLCRKSESIVTKYMSLYTTPVILCTLDESMLNMSPTGY